ncbi:MAG: hypothetical protein ACRDHW_15705 [Ktedonobacteraceae bacterium]
MKSSRNLLEWGARHRYPQLVLSERDVLKAGEQSWQTFIASASRARKALARKRIARWDSIAEKTA